MEYSITQKENSRILAVDNLLNEYENRRILDEIDELILDENIHFIVDLGQMDYINSTGFSFLIAILTKTRNAGGETIICNINEKISELLVMMKLKNVFTVCDTLEESIEKLKESTEKIATEKTKELLDD